MADIPSCPPTLRAIQHYLKVAQEHATRDPVVCYWSQLHALQTALNIDRKSDESKVFLVKMMDRLEGMKKELKDNEAITNEIAAQAHIENYALKLFLWADSQDRASNFGKNVVKAFYTSGMLFDVLTTFGELSEEVQQNRKYAKWKAAYIHNCLKNGETPIPGPMKSGEEDYDEAMGGQSSTSHEPRSSLDGLDNDSDPPNAASTTDEISPAPTVQPNNITVPSFTPPVTPFQPSGPPASGFGGFDGTLPHQPVSPSSASTPPFPDTSLKQEGGVSLTPEQMSKAMKYCKWAGSALNYDDVPTAITNLEKALHLLKTGIDC